MPGGRFESLRDSMDFRGNFSYRLSSARASMINFVHFEEGHVDAGRAMSMPGGLNGPAIHSYVSKYSGFIRFMIGIVHVIFIFLY